MIEAWYAGACEPHPLSRKNSGAYAYIIKRDGRPVKTKGRLMGRVCASEIAEYTALIDIFSWLKSQGCMRFPVRIYGHNLSAQKINQKIPARPFPWKSLMEETRILQWQFSDAVIQFVPRDENREAIELCKTVLTEAGIKIKLMDRRHKARKGAG